MKYEGTTLRHELKYYISERVYYILRERFRYILKPDENMEDEDGYLISSIYFDDVNNSALEEKISGNRFRKKYRIRLYNHQDDLVKLECKEKYDSLISKQSANLSRDEYNSMLEGNNEFLICRKEEVCKQFYGLHTSLLLKPVTVVEYKREAYVLNEGNVRITFDKNISASIHSLDVFHKEYITSEVLPSGIMVLEVKYDDYLPQYVWKLIQSQSTERCAISKYVMCRNKNRRVKLL